MVSKVAAIAMLAMVILPIGLGYALSFDEVERDGWRTTETINVSDQFLNSEYPYYINSNSPNNNGALLFNDRLLPPAYNSVSSVPSSLPVYTVTDTTIPAGSRTLRASPTVQDLAFNGTSITNFERTQTYVSGYPIYWISAPLPIRIVTDPVVEYTEEYSVYVVPSDGGFTFIYDSGQFRSSGPCHIYCDGSSVGWNIYSYSSTAISGSNYTLNAIELLPSSQPPSNLILTTADGVQYAGRADGAVYRSGMLTTADGVVYSGVTRVELANVGNYRQSSEVVVSGQYVQPSEGWKWPIVGNVLSGPIALAGAVIDSAVFYLHLPSLSSYQTLGILSTLDELVGAEDQFSIYRDNGVVSVMFGTDSQIKVLGAYSDVQVTISADSVKVSGVSAWPSMYSTASVLNSVEFERTIKGQFAGLGDHGHSTDVSVRIDNVQILGGYFPTTKDYAFNVGESFPNRSVSMDFPTVGIYGNSITVSSGSATVTYTVADGKLSDLDNTSMLNAVFSSTIVDGEYSISLNGKEILTGTDPMTITFGGDWSMAVNLYLLESFTSSSLEWVPGVYAFDQTDSTVVGILTCVGVFIALAMVRPFSGAKMIMLAIVCGCGAVIFLIML